MPIRDWLHYGDHALAHYADHPLAPTCRSPLGSYMPSVTSCPEDPRRTRPRRPGSLEGRTCVASPKNIEAELRDRQHLGAGQHAKENPSAWG
jgi:hypothetical protein